MRTYFVAICIFILILFSISAEVSGMKVAPRISDREIIEALTELKAGQKAIQQQIADLKDSTNKQIADTNRRIDELKDFMFWGFGILFAGMFTLVGFVLWDRRTALSPAIRKNKELEEREDRVEKALKEYAYKEPRLAEILRNAGIM